jgi:quinol monooxygenase YgiN
MIIVSVKLTPKEELKNDFLAAFHEVSKTVRQEKGCLEYQIYQESESCNTLFIFERWESKASLDAHLSTPHMNVFFNLTSTWLACENKMNIYEVK